MDRVALFTQQVVQQLATGGIVVDHGNVRGHGGLLPRAGPGQASRLREPITEASI